MSATHLGAGEWDGKERSECGLEYQDEALKGRFSYNLGSITCKPCLMGLANRGIASMQRLTEVLKGNA